MTTPPPQASPSRQSNIPANSRRSGPRVSLAAWSPNNLTQRRHGGSPLEHRTTAAGRLPPHLLGPNLNHRVPTPIIPRLASITTPLRWIRAKASASSSNVTRATTKNLLEPLVTFSPVSPDSSRKPSTNALCQHICTDCNVAIVSSFLASHNLPVCPLTPSMLYCT